MKDQASEEGRVTIRTADEQSGFVDITLEVRGKEIVSMHGVDGNGDGWVVTKLKFTGGKKDRKNDECKCCEIDGTGKVSCVTCPC